MSTRYQAPGRADREGLTLVELFQLFPNDEKAEQWFEQQMWPNGPVCPDCGSLRYSVTRATSNMPYRCRDCWQYFSVRKRSVMHSSKLGYQKWAIALYQILTGLKGVSAMKLHRDLGISYPSAWHLLHRIRTAMESGELAMFGPVVEVDETFVGGKLANRHESQRDSAPEKAPVIGAKDRKTGKVRAKVIKATDSATLQGFVRGLVVPGAQVFSDGHPGYTRLDGDYDHRAVQHSAGTYVIEQIHTNGIEAFWSVLKRGIVGVYHHVSVKHLDLYVDEFAGRHNLRDLGTEAQMSAVARGMVGKRLRYADLVA